MMTLGSTPRSSSFLAGARYTRALAKLSERGESQTAQGHVLRSQLEDLWYEIPEEEQDLLDSLSADLRSLVEQPPPGPEPTEQEKIDLAAAVSDASWTEVLALLRECPRLSQGVDGAQLRAQCWRAVGVIGVIFTLQLAISDGLGTPEILQQLGDELVAALKQGTARLHAHDCVAATQGLGDRALDYMHQIILAEDNHAPIGSDAVERAITKLQIAAVAFTTQLVIAEGRDPAPLRRIEEKLVAAFEVYDKVQVGL